MGLVHTIGHVVHMTCARNCNGYDITSQNYFADLKNRLDEGSEGVCRSSLCEARGQLKWEAFEYLLNEVNSLSPNHTWKKHRLFAVDGTCLNLPHQDEIIESFPLGKNKRTRAHYPKGLLLTVTDVLSGVPLLAELGHYRTDSERGMLANNFSKIPKGSILLLDRGYDGVRTFKQISDEDLHFIVRVRTRTDSRISQNIMDFLSSGKKEQVVWIRNLKGTELKVRLLRYGLDVEGLPIVLATNLLCRSAYSRSEIMCCYKKRWKVETLYYRVKKLLQLELFHARSINGVKQEIWANLFVLGLTAVLINQAIKMAKMNTNKVAPNFKNAIEIIRRHLKWIILTRNEKQKKKILQEMYIAIIQVTCCKQPGRKNPRFSRQPQSSWRRPDGKNRARTQAEKKRVKAAA